MRAVVLIGVVAAVAALGAALVGSSDGGDGIGRDGSEVVEDAPEGPLPIEGPPVAYRVVYRNESPDADGPIVTTDVLLVRRPFSSSLRAHSGTSTSGRLVSETVATFGRLRIVGGSTPLVIAAEPGVSPSDVRLAPVVDDALAEGVLELRERREVLGRECQVYRSGEPLGSGKLRAPTAEKFTDTCIDGAGLVLEELLTVEGELLFRRVALEVEEDPDIPAAAFSVDEEPVHVDQGGGSVLRMQPGSRPPVPFWILPDPPTGFRSCGRFSVVPPQPENTSDPALRPFLRSSTVDVWVRGPDLVLVRQSGTLGGTSPIELDDPSVDLGALGSGDVVLSAQGSAVRAELAGGRVLELVGTLPVEDLVGLARTMEQVEAGELEVVQGPPELTC